MEAISTSEEERNLKEEYEDYENPLAINPDYIYTLLEVAGFIEQQPHSQNGHQQARWQQATWGKSWSPETKAARAAQQAEQQGPYTARKHHAQQQTPPCETEVTRARKASLTAGTGQEKKG